MKARLGIHKQVPNISFFTYTATAVIRKCDYASRNPRLESSLGESQEHPWRCIGAGCASHDLGFGREMHQGRPGSYFQVFN